LVLVFASIFASAQSRSTSVAFSIYSFTHQPALFLSPPQKKATHCNFHPAVAHPKYIPYPKQLSLAALVTLDALKVARLETRVVPDSHLLLLVHLARVDQLLDATCAEETVHGHVARLPEAVRTIHCL
jgi:hypothetical protein